MFNFSPISGVSNYLTISHLELKIVEPDFQVQFDF